MENQYSKFIPGLEIAKYKQEILSAAISKYDRKPKLLLIQIGDDPASDLYVSLKVAAAKNIGIEASVSRYPANVDRNQILDLIHSSNQDRAIHGIMIQVPIPGGQLSADLQLFDAIALQKDVDGLSSASLGKLWQMKTIRDISNLNAFIAATPLGVLDSLLWKLQPSMEQFDDISYNRYSRLNELLSGKSVLIINRSNIVGKPLAALLTHCDATVTLAHSKSSNIKQNLSRYDYILSATGVDYMWNVTDFRTDQVVIDIGINSKPGSPVRGDVDKQSFSQSANSPLLAPVPGGVGPLTVINLLCNTFLSYLRGI